jgi:NDP-hexose-3-ketoreductase
MVRIGIICPSEIASRRFLPALKESSGFTFAGIAYANKSEWTGATDEVISSERIKANKIVELFGGKVFDSYNKILQSKDIEAIYLPLPPALHFLWSSKALEAGKHIIIEKPATTSLQDTKHLIDLAKIKDLVIHENYMFVFHSQLEVIKDIIINKEIGDVRLYRISFGFPKRPTGDFRYQKVMGGGALLDVGGYTFKYARLLLGKSAKIAYAYKNLTPEFDIDLYGSAAIINNEGVTIQIAYGIDNSYKCELEVWGSLGYLKSNRIFTAPAGYAPQVELVFGNNTEKRYLQPDDTFKKSLTYFQNCIENSSLRYDSYSEILSQANLLQEFIEKVKP